MNTIITSREAILTVCRTLVAKGGLQSLNMRSVAEKCHVSVGSVYNYFPSKSDLIAATVEDIWQDILHWDKSAKKEDSFPEYLAFIFERIQEGVVNYPNFFTAHSMSFIGTEKAKARPLMENCFVHMKAELLEVLQNDSKVSPSAFSEDFTKQAFVDFVFSNLLSLLLNEETSCKMLKEIIRRSIYA